MPNERPIAHRIYFPDLAGHAAAPAPGTHLAIEGPEAHHAVRVKRAREGERVALFDGLGRVVVGEVVGVRSGKNASLEIAPGPVTEHPPLSPRIEVWCPPPKGDRLETMIDQLSQIGVAHWRPMRCERSERDAFRADKVERASIESAKQCARAHLLEIGDWVDFQDAARDPRALLADASGEPAGPAHQDCVLLLGPEGGWTDAERAHAAASGCRTARFGPHIMRIETAAVAGAACLLAHAGDHAGTFPDQRPDQRPDQIESLERTPPERRPT